MRINREGLLAFVAQITAKAYDDGAIDSLVFESKEEITVFIADLLGGMGEGLKSGVEESQTPAN